MIDIFRVIEYVAVSSLDDVQKVRELFKNILVDIVNHRFVFTLALIMLAVVTISLASNGISIQDVIIIMIVGAAGFAIWRALVTDQTPGITSVERFDLELRAGKPTLVEFYSRYCAGCLAAKPIVDQLEQEAGNSLRIVRLDIDEEPGKTLLNRFGVLFTPTFVYFDASGNKLRESVLVLDKARIMHELEHA